ncbi:hypothetical protein LL912_08720 [Niabella sp. CC-SYL272]|uniref:hypothetical protein n=1 Tax=Niabella agricola TaxID=2891571 RepID=UPI001F341BE4|nr:hypothetical protein [Niabella agricola]MCF3108858.1 hypothetical protein [Niabella agricola]
MKPKKSKHPPPEIITEFEKLPVDIQRRATKIIQNSLAEHSADARFNTAVLYDLDACCLTEDEAIHYTPIPRYHLHYIYMNSKNSKVQYSFELNFDVYGQVLKYGLPRNGSYTVAVLNGRSEAVKQVSQYAATKGYKTKSAGERLFHDPFQDCLIWQVLLFQYREKQDGQPIKYCRAIAVDIRSGWIYYDRMAIVRSQQKNTFVSITCEINDPRDRP